MPYIIQLYYLSTRCAASEALSVEALVQELKGSSIFSDGSIAVFKEVWKNDGGTLSSLPKQALSVGEVRNMDSTIKGYFILYNHDQICSLKIVYPYGEGI